MGFFKTTSTTLGVMEKMRVLLIWLVSELFPKMPLMLLISYSCPDGDIQDGNPFVVELDSASRMWDPSHPIPSTLWVWAPFSHQHRREPKCENCSVGNPVKGGKPFCGCNLHFLTARNKAVLFSWHTRLGNTGPYTDICIDKYRNVIEKAF